MSSRLRKSNLSLIYSSFWLTDWLLLEVQFCSILRTHSRKDLKASADQSHGQTGLCTTYVEVCFSQRKKYRVRICTDLWARTNHMARRSGQLIKMVSGFLEKESWLDLYRNFRIRIKWEHICFFLNAHRGVRLQKRCSVIRGASLPILVSFFH